MISIAVSLLKEFILDWFDDLLEEAPERRSVGLPGEALWSAASC